MSVKFRYIDIPIRIRRRLYGKMPILAANAPLGWFDPELVASGWFSHETNYIRSWFDQEWVPTPRPFAYLEIISEAGSASETESMIRNIFVSDSEAGSATTTQSMVRGLVLSVSETGSATTTQSMVKGLVLSIAEAGSAASTQSMVRGLVVSISEAGSATSTQAVAAFIPGFVPSRRKPRKFLQTTKPKRRRSRAATLSQKYIASVSETGAASTAQSMVLGIVVSISESGSASSAQAVVGTTPGYTGARRKPRFYRILPKAKKHRTRAATLPQRYIASVSESGAASTAQSMIRGLVLSIAEAGSASETESMIRNIFVSDSEAGSATTSQSMIKGLVLSVSETGAASSTQSMVRGLVLSIAEAGSASTSQSMLLAIFPSVSESGSAIATQSLALIFIPHRRKARITRILSSRKRRRSRAATLPQKYIASIAEAGSAADVESMIRHIFVSDTEAGSALSSQSITVQIFVTDAESGAAATTQSMVRGKPLTVAEAGSATTTQSMVRGLVLSLSEAGAATNTQSMIKGLVLSMAEAGAALDNPNAPTVHFHFTVAEAGLAKDFTSDITPRYPKGTSSPVPAYQPVPLSRIDDWRPWGQQMARVINGILTGKMNATTTVTLAASVATTTLKDSRISATSHIGFMPSTSNAAAALAGLYITGQKTGQATINHANTATTDRTFTVLIIG